MTEEDTVGYLLTLCLGVIPVTAASFFPLAYLPITWAIFGNSITVLYLVITAYALIAGGVSYIIIQRKSKGYRKNLLSGVVGSSVLAITAKLSEASKDLIIGLIKDTAENSQGALFSQEGSYNPLAGFLIVFFLFNLPILVRYRKEIVKRPKYVLVYLLPIIVYFAV
ncbi:MAG: hypothetical protein MUP58_03215 [Candidatus Nanohaloarchaeota archaeon QJJ-9]|nr:hypothetical protein [Candidatus Nanohaloarchaeota archaeon QJJ-9]